MRRSLDVEVEPAAAKDLPAILRLLMANSLPQDGLAAHVGTALVARARESVVGCAALEVYSASALLRSVAVHEAYHGMGVGRRLTVAALDLARQRHVEDVYLLTTTASGFFRRFGFVEVSRQRVPSAVQASVEFTSACPDTALAMWRTLRENGAERKRGDA